MIAGGMNRHGGVSRSVDNILHKASVQLKGGRVSSGYGNNDEDNDITDNYLKTISKKPAKTINWDKFGELSDLSDDGGDKLKSKLQDESSDIGKGNKFLKKKNANSASDNKDLISGDSRATKQPSSSANKQSISKVNERSSGLDKVQALNAKFSGKGNYPLTKQPRIMSDSDEDLSLSMDEEVLADVRNLKNKHAGQTGIEKGKTTLSKANDLKRDVKGPPSTSQVQKPATFTRSSFHSSVPVASDDDDDSQSSSMQIGKSGNKFLKKSTSVQVEETVNATSKKKDLDVGNTQTAKSRTSYSSFKTPDHRPAMLEIDSDEESLAEYIGALSSDSKTSDKVKPKVMNLPNASKQEQERGRGHGQGQGHGHGQGKRHGHGHRQGQEQELEEQELDEQELEEQERKQEQKKPSKSPSLPMHLTTKIVDDESISEDESVEFKVNLQDLDSLGFDEDPIPVKNVSNKSSKTKTNFSSQKIESETNQFIGLHSVDELLDDSIQDLEPLRIADVLYESDFEVAANTSRGVSPMPLRSILSPTPRSLTPKSSRSRVRLLAEVTEIRSRSPSPEPIATGRLSVDDEADEITSTVRTVVDSDDNASMPPTIRTSDSQSRASDSDDTSTVKNASDSESGVTTDQTSAIHSSRRGHRRHSRISSRRSSVRTERYYSDDFTNATDDTSQASESYSDMSSVSKSSIQKKKKTKEQHVQTGLDVGLHYHWTMASSGFDELLSSKYGQAFAKPASVAATVVSAETLEALTSYSPATLALNDMLRQQLGLMSQYVALQKMLHQNFVQSCSSSSYHYTTLEETREYIRKHRKPVISYEEALCQVKEEMGLA